MIENDCLPRGLVIELTPIKRSVFEQLPDIAREVLQEAGFSIE